MKFPSKLIDAIISKNITLQLEQNNFLKIELNDLNFFTFFI